VCASIALGLFVLGLNIAAAMVALFSMVLDSTDGDLARAKNMTSNFGAFFDAVLDRYADIGMLSGMIYWSLLYENLMLPELVAGVGLLAIAGSLNISYSRARAEASLGEGFSGQAAIIASRDTRLFLMVIGSILGQMFWTLTILAVLTNVVVAWRIFLARNMGKG
tara:strand:+ start:2007 stop:2501 length:495 start_codon:yes stop_codon:yes gene_type:complete